MRNPDRPDLPVVDRDASVPADSERPAAEPRHGATGQDDRIKRVMALECLIRDLHRAAHVTLQMCMHEDDYGTTRALGSLSMFMAGQTERLAEELCDAYYGEENWRRA